MTTTPTAAEFAAARFAQHPDGRTAHRLGGARLHPWFIAPGLVSTDRLMAENGWRIVTPVDPSDPDVIEQAARRGHEACREFWGHIDTWEERTEKARDSWRAVARAVYSPPPARPEGAEEIQTALVNATNAEGLELDALDASKDAYRALADSLASRGVRVGGGENA